MGPQHESCGKPVKQYLINAVNETFNGAAT